MDAPRHEPTLIELNDQLDDLAARLTLMAEQLEGIKRRAGESDRMAALERRTTEARLASLEAQVASLRAEIHAGFAGLRSELRSLRSEHLGHV